VNVRELVVKLREPMVHPCELVVNMW
jgi:hypothetical protein